MDKFQKPNNVLENASTQIINELRYYVHNFINHK